MLRPWKVGLTGGIGSGKSVVADIFARHHVPVIDADEISRNLTARPGPITQQIAEVFGSEVLDHNGYLDRAALRTIVFSDEKARHKLESILHPQVYKIIAEAYSRIQTPYCIISIPLLLETDASEKVDRVLVVDCPVNMQIERTYNRDKVPREIIEKIIRSQITRSARLAAADDVITNDGSISDLETRVFALHQEYLKLSRAHPD